MTWFWRTLMVIFGISCGLLSQNFTGLTGILVAAFGALIFWCFTNFLFREDKGFQILGRVFFLCVIGILIGFILSKIEYLPLVPQVWQSIL